MLLIRMVVLVMLIIIKMKVDKDGRFSHVTYNKDESGQLDEHFGHVHPSHLK
jgi:hypothetical protein